MTAPKQVVVSVAILDYGFGNIRSAQRALQRAGAEVTVTDDVRRAGAADGLAVPGVGAFSACMDGIDKVGATPMLRERVAAGRPVLGICVGMQILFEAGDEHGRVRAGMGLLPGTVRRIDAPVLPHMGWNTVAATPDSAMFAGLPADARFYFVHSYAAAPEADWPPGCLVTRTAATGTAAPFVSAVEHGPLWACQFHPEKSGDAGATLLSNWLAAVEGTAR